MPTNSKTNSTSTLKHSVSKQNGISFPLGATVYNTGVNFCVYSKNATEVELLLFNSADDTTPNMTINFDPIKNKTYHYWHKFVPNLKVGQIYAYRINGPFKPEEGHRFDHDKILLDPYGKLVAMPSNYNRKDACDPGDNCSTALKSIVVDNSSYDWENDTHPKHSFSTTVIYEMHVKGFTKNPNSGVPAKKRGTYAGLIEKIPYLQDLGITAVELLPVFQFDPYDCMPGMTNYWGYAPISFFAPHSAYSSDKNILAPITEFKDMVKALHKAGIEVILDVVYNHTSEGNHLGPTSCFKGFENTTYYILEKNKKYYSNYTGTGNTLNANNPIVRRMIIDSLKYWVQEMHVDGFRFDLASILSRDESGCPLANPPILWDIETDPVLAGIKLIAEAWDAAGLYQVGSFIGDSWNEWNGKFRDDIRSFLKGDTGKISKIASRLLGSPDLYSHEQREAEQSVNFVTYHDGFTLNDLVSYNHKHNQLNGENSNDGCNNNRSWNCGVEGPSNKIAVKKLRNQQVKNFFALTLLSYGTPMILMGDEVRRTQNGNNNAYCQDNKLSWFDWSLLDKHADIFRFVKKLLKYRLAGKSLIKDIQITLDELLHHSSIVWHGLKLNQPDWSENSHTLSLTAKSYEGHFMTHLMINAYWKPLDFETPPTPDNTTGKWKRIIDTYLDSPDDIHDWHDAQVINKNIYNVQARSIVIFLLRTP